MKLQKFLCWNWGREEEDGKVFECFDSQCAATEAAEHFNNEDIHYPSEQEMFVKGPDGVIEAFTVYMTTVPYYRAKKVS